MKKTKSTLQEFNKTSNQLEYLPWNRKVTLRKDLIKSMQLHGFLIPLLVIATDIVDGIKRLYIGDGQNRSLAAFELNLPVQAVVIEKTFKDVKEFVHFIAMLNNTQKAWSTTDYIRTFATIGYEPYKVLQRIQAKYSYFSLTTIASLLYGIYGKMGGGIARKVKSGEFKINHLVATNYTLNLAARLTKYEEVTNTMVLALHYVSNMKDFNEEAFIEKYKQNAKSIKELKLNDFSQIFSSWRK